jgi:hypothetical protein
VVRRLGDSTSRAVDGAAAIIHEPSLPLGR